MPDRPGPTSRDLTRDAVGHGCFAVDLDGQVHSWVDSVRDALIEHGVLYCDADRVWRLHWRGRGEDLLKELGAWMACCDFCSARPVCWNIPCESFSLPPLQIGDQVGPPAESVGDWAACEACGTAITEGQRAALLARTQRVYGHDRTSRRFQQLLQRKFWAHYRGGATRIPPHPFGH